MRWSKIIVVILTIVLLIILGISAFNMYEYYKLYNKSEKVYDKVEKMFENKESVSTTKTEIQTYKKNKEQIETTKEHKKMNKSNFTWNYNTLVSQYPDAEGYIRNEIMSYPVVQGADNEFYLHHLIDGTYDFAGTLFIDSRIDEKFEAQNCIIYGHCMKNGSMFGSLYKFNQQGYANQYGEFDIYAGNNQYRYKVFASFTANKDSDVYISHFKNKKAFLTYINNMKKESNITSDYTFTGDENIITFSTCTNDDEVRQIVMLVRID